MIFNDFFAIFVDNCYLTILYNNINFNFMKELVNQIKAEIDAFIANADAQVEKGNKAAGTRARKAALNISKLMKDFRKASVEASK